MPSFRDTFTGHGITRIAIPGPCFVYSFQILSYKMNWGGAFNIHGQMDTGGRKEGVEDPGVQDVSMLIGPTVSLNISR